MESPARGIVRVAGADQENGIKNYRRYYKGSTCGFSLEGVPASCLTGESMKSCLSVLYGYTKLGCEGHEQSVNALYLPHRDEEKRRVHHTALVIESWSFCAEEVTSSGKSMVAYSDSIAS